MTTEILLEWCRSDGPAITLARFDAWPDAANADECHDALLILGGISETEARESGWETLLGELALLGKIKQVTGANFYRRVHESKSDRVYSSYQERAEWFNPDNKKKVVLSAWNQLIDLLIAVLSIPLPAGERSVCLFRLLKVAKWNYRVLLEELRWAWRRYWRN